ncbi:hypothetical protein GT347_04175 [Xylophilus rhododendri]|uniref:Uncharacterized protein n=1 Tax=Xylophilus rhododendri TaxID=2697032 RepID=A0A857J304_9BURK|nr:hypothetical protein [Xylophilus rhododendri]QHI97245.1 hypothetical protein GT347_04175 [Xylophilus rhododendri]
MLFRCKSLALIGAFYLLGNFCHAQVQILHLQDNASGSDAFCVVAAAAGHGVRLTFVNSSGSAADSLHWLARNAAGEAIEYRQFVEYLDGTAPVEVSGLAKGVFLVDPVRVSRSAAECGAGTLVKRVVRDAGLPLPARGPYVDIVTVLAAPI